MKSNILQIQFLCKFAPLTCRSSKVIWFSGSTVKYKLMVSAFPCITQIFFFLLPQIIVFFKFLPIPLGYRKSCQSISLSKIKRILFNKNIIKIDNNLLQIDKLGAFYETKKWFNNFLEGSCFSYWNCGACFVYIFIA